MNLNISVSGEGSTALFTLSGRLDAMTSDSFFEAVAAEVSKGRTQVRVDASQVSYISSAGLRAMLQAHRKTASAKGSFHIVSASPFVSQTISMSGLDLLLAGD